MTPDVKNFETYLLESSYKEAIFAQEWKFAPNIFSLHTEQKHKVVTYEERCYLELVPFNQKCKKQTTSNLLESCTTFLDHPVGVCMYKSKVTLAEYKCCEK